MLRKKVIVTLLIMSARISRLVSSQTFSLILLLGLISIFGVWLLLYSTPEGLGLNDDSIAYISGARGILSGEGYRELWLVSKGYLIHFPPGFSGMLAAIGFITRIDPLRIARVMNALFFGGNASLLGLLCWRGTKSKLAAIFLAALFVATPAFLRIHSNAMSEPQYIFLTLITILLFDIYFERGQIIWLITSGLIVSVAYLTRYAALALIATILFSLLILHQDWRTRLTRSAIFLASAFPLIAAWSIRNEIAGGSVTNRSAGWHPITAENANTGMREFSEFLVPFGYWRRALDKIPDFYSNILILAVLILLVWIVISGMRYFFQPTVAPRPSLIPFVNGLYILGYFSSLVITMTVFDPATKFQLRIVAPIFVSFLLLAVFVGAYLARKNIAVKSLMVVIALFFFSLFSYAQKQTADELSRGGQLYASYRWYDSTILARVRQLPPDVTIHTNQLEAVYLYTNRACALLPGEDSMAETQQRVKDGKAVIVLFVSRGLDQETIDYYEDLGKGLHAIREGASVMYTAP
ncbi:MAG: glycosyltransferase family 39 protein [Anaerolineales bacterium]|nr:glycosyltransferase family 39 protein [Anaerolineales bacterium]